MLRDPSLVPLSHQHHNGLALCVLTERALGRDASPEAVARLARRVVDRYEMELANHFELEEQVLFPLCVSPLTEELTAEHRTLERLVEALRAAPSVDDMREFTALLRTHIRREENELFESVQRLLPRQELDRIGVELDRRAVRVCL